MSSSPSFNSSFTRLILILSSVVAFGALAIDMYLPALPVMAIDLAATSAQLQLSLSVFFSGFCIGMLIYGPLSDYFGRRKLLLSGIALFAVSSLICAFVNDVQHLLILRGFQALGCGACVVMARAATRDIFPPAQLPSMMSKMSLVTMTAPLLAPSIGAVCLMIAGWRFIFVVLAVFASGAFYFVHRDVPETHQPDKSQGLHVFGVLRSYWALLTWDNVTLMMLMACAMSGMFAFISGAPFVYTQLLGFTELEFALLFGSNIIAMSLVTTLNLYLLKRFSAQKLMVYQASVLAFAGLALVLLTPYGRWIIPFVVLYVAHVNALCANGMAILLHRHDRQQAGSVTALAVSLQFATAAVSTFLVSVFSHRPAFAMTGVMLVFAMVACVCAWIQKEPAK